MESNVQEVMSNTHAVVSIMRDRAHILQFDTRHLDAGEVQANSHATARHDSGICTEHEFFAQVCDAIESASDVIFAGTRTVLSEFSRYASKHRPETMARIRGYDVLRHPTQDQLVALARQFFVRADAKAAQEVGAEGCSP